MVHTSTFWLRFGSLSPAVTLKIRSMSPKPDQLFIMSQCYIHANLIKIHPLVHEISCKQESANADANRIRTKNNMSPSPSVGDIIIINYNTYWNGHKNCFVFFTWIMIVSCCDLSQRKPLQKYMYSSSYIVETENAKTNIMVFFALD